MKDLNTVLTDFRVKNITTIIVGDLNVTSWKKEYAEWIEQNEPWELSNPAVPTFTKGLAPDAMLMALGEYIPEGLVLTESEEDDNSECLENSPAYISERPVLGDHMALFLTFQTHWPQTKRGLRKYDIKNLTNKKCGGIQKKNWKRISGHKWTSNRISNTEDYLGK